MPLVLLPMMSQNTQDDEQNGMKDSESVEMTEAEDVTTTTASSLATTRVGSEEDLHHQPGHRLNNRKSPVTNRIPLHVVRNILLYLPFKEQIKLSRVDRKFGDVVDVLLSDIHSLSYRSFSYNRVNSGPDEGHLMEGRLNVLSKMSKLKSFEVPDVVEFRLPEILADYCPRIEEIRCRSLQLVYDYAVSLLKKGSKVHLKMIYLTTTDALDAELLVKILLLNERINVSTSSVCLHPTLTKYENFFKTHPSYLGLVYQKVTRLVISSALHVRALNLRNFCNLSSLEILTNCDRDIISYSLCNLTHLKELTIKTDIENFNLLSQFPMELEKLHFTDTLTSVAANTGHLMSFLKTRCHKLQELTIMCKKFRGNSADDLMVDLISLLKDSCPLLHSIHIHNYCFFRFEYCKVTRKLAISMLQQESLEMLFNMFPRTRTFDLETGATDYTISWFHQLESYSNVRRNQAITATLKVHSGNTTTRQHNNINLDVTMIR